MPAPARQPNPLRKPPAPVPLVVVRCWNCRRIVTEAEPGRWVRCKCASCNQWVNEAAPTDQAA